MVDKTRQEVFDGQESLDEYRMFNSHTFEEVICGIDSFHKELKAKYQKQKFGPFHFRWNVDSGYDYLTLSVNVYRMETDREMAERVKEEEEEEAKKLAKNRLREEKKINKLMAKLAEDEKSERKLLAELKVKYGEV